jgi:hypothetical protein
MKRLNILMLVAPVVCLLVFPHGGPTQQAETSISLRDNSDWWSLSRTAEPDEIQHPEEREVSKANFRILGIDLGEDTFARAQSMLGRAAVVERGDASTGRRQICFYSASEKQRTYLIFERGEVAYSSIYSSMARIGTAKSHVQAQHSCLRRSLLSPGFE